MVEMQFHLHNGAGRKGEGNQERKKCDMNGINSIFMSFTAREVSNWKKCHTLYFVKLNLKRVDIIEQISLETYFDIEPNEMMMTVYVWCVSVTCA